MLNKLARGVLASAIATAVAGWCAMIAPASATMISPNLNANNGEPSLYQIMNSTYGAGNWSQYDSATTAYGTNSGVSIGVEARALYASDSSTFGVLQNTTTFVPVISFNGSLTSQSATILPSMLSTNVGGQFETAFKNDTTGQYFYSNAAENPDHQAHLIEFQILNMPNTYVFAWEDSVGGDYDYNDLVMQYQFTMDPDPVPEPMTISLLGGALLFGSCAQRYLKRKQARA
jgi:hypothetical protein